MGTEIGLCGKSLGMMIPTHRGLCIGTSGAQACFFRGEFQKEYKRTKTTGQGRTRTSFRKELCW